jgi:hypothetical protein
MGQIADLEWPITFDANGMKYQGTFVTNGLTVTVKLADEELTAHISRSTPQFVAKMLMRALIARREIHSAG